MSEEVLLNNGYKEWEVNKIFNPHASKMFQKRFRNKKRHTQYFITIYQYVWEGEPEPSYIVELQFEKDRYIMNFSLFAFHNDMTIEEIEEEVYDMWNKLCCKYYDEEGDL